MRAFLSCFASFSVKLIWKMCGVVLGEILVVCLKTLTSDGKYPAQGCEDLKLQFQMQLSEK